MLDINSHDKIIARIQFFKDFLFQVAGEMNEDKLHSENEEEDALENLFDEIYEQYIDLFDDILYFG
jgi:hypothetical protein